MACPNVNSNNRPIGVSYDTKDRAVGFLELSSIEVESISATNVSAASFTPAQFPFIFNGTISATAYLGAGTGGNFLDLGDVTASTIQPNQIVFGSLENPGTLTLSSTSSVVLYNGFILASQVSTTYATIATTNQLQSDIQDIVDNLPSMIPEVINDLSDVQTSSNTQGNLLTWSSSINKWVNTPSSIFSIGGGASSLSSLNDVIVDVPELNIGNILTWDGSYWINTPSSIFSASSGGGGVSSLSSLNDVIVDIPELNIGNILSWDGSYWVNTPSSIFITTPTVYFSSLLDTPANYTGASSNFVIVNPSATGLIFSSASFASSIHNHTFSSLTDTPTNYTGASSNFVIVNPSATGLQFSSASFASSTHSHTFSSLTDTPSNYTGASSNFVIVNSGGTGLVFSSANFASSTHNHTFESLSDTLIADLENGDIPVWNGSYWVNTPSSIFSTSGGGVSSLSALNDVDIDIPELNIGNVLTWNGSNWVNTPSSILSSSGGGISEAFATENYLNASGDSVSASFYLQTISSTTLSSTDISAVNIFADNLIINTLDLSANNLSATNLYADNFILSTLELSANSISATTYQNITLNNTLEDVEVEFLGVDDILTWDGSVWVNSTLASKIPPLSLNFVGLDDTPADYTGASSNFVIVNPSATGLIFSSASFASSTHTHSYSIDNLSDVFIDDTELEIGSLLMWDGAQFINIDCETGSNKVLGWDTVLEKWKGRTISYGTSAPSGGENGDIYLQYEE